MTNPTKKKEYSTPTIEVVEIQCTGILANSNRDVYYINNDAYFYYGGGWNGYAR